MSHLYLKWCQKSVLTNFTKFCIWYLIALKIQVRSLSCLTKTCLTFLRAVIFYKVISQTNWRIHHYIRLKDIAYYWRDNLQGRVALPARTTLITLYTVPLPKVGWQLQGLWSMLFTHIGSSFRTWEDLPVVIKLTIGRRLKDVESQGVWIASIFPWEVSRTICMTSMLISSLKEGSKEML